MAMKKASGIITIFIVLAMVMVEVEVAAEVVCDVNSLHACLPVIKDPSLHPTTECCTNLKNQQPCFCIFLKDPKFQAYFDSPGATKLGSACAVHAPVCLF
ncbi:non-specific lipid-transfer protein 2-like [Apium graveolens]|uniref:non-specific lipid-transfer protein 2-like n=1 Tax=Apium graveolens TaxID=4045 RepID=UPI003D7B3AC5